MLSASPILEFENVAYRSPSEAFASFSGGSLKLQAGALAAVHIDRDSEHVPIADLASGLLDPMSGRILFQAQDWSTLDPFTASAARGRIGCVLEKPSWISSLSVQQNIMLSERHHTNRSDAEIAEEAEALCRLIGLKAVPQLRPDNVRSRELRLLEWVRAFMGTPALVVLVYPERFALSTGCSACLQLVQNARANGSAVLWISDFPGDWQQAGMRDADHFQIKDERWLPLNGEGIQ
jgi:phospholipid/cholesterol/gamma-HCH transport system ATP-binding protein